MGFWNRLIGNKKKDLSELVREFLATSSASDARQVLEQHPELLSENVDSILSTLSQELKSEGHRKAIQSHRNILSLCREMGIDKAFEKISNSSNETSEDDLQMILEEIVNLSKPQDISRKIIMLQHALSLVHRQSNAELWAALQMDLGKSIRLNLQENQGNSAEQAIEHYNEALKVYTHMAFPVQWAWAQSDLAASYKMRTLGDKDENIEKAIKYLNLALEVYTCQDFPVQWAAIHNNLAFTYSDYNKGERAENIEKTIEHYNLTLEVYTYKDFPEEWARTQNTLAYTYKDRINGHRAENIEKAIEYFNQALKVYTHQNFPEEWVKIQCNLAIAYLDRIRGNKANNIEIAIEKFNKSLEIYTVNDFPEEWAKTQINLGIAYVDRVKGNIADNIEKAIEHYNQAFKVINKRNFPAEWANTMRNLSIAYRKRKGEDRAEYLEKAIEYCNQALEVFNDQDFSEDWADTQNSMANAYTDRIKGNRAENIEKAFIYYNQALEIYTHGNYPEDWALTQKNLGEAYRVRIRGNKAENFEKAIKHCNQALEVYTHDDFPVGWADTQSNLALAYLSRIKGDVAENIEKAIEHFSHALKVNTQKDSSLNWATIQSNLALAYLSRIKGDVAENIEKAIEHCNQSLKVYNPHYFPEEWAIIQNNLAGAYNNRTRGDKIENIEKAIEYCHQALKVRTKNTFPEEWAGTQNNLANAYKVRILGDRAENTEQAIEYLNKALEVYTYQDFPMNWAMTQGSLANAYLKRIKGDKADNIERAIELFNKSLEVYTENDFPKEWARAQNNLANAYSNRILGDRAGNIDKAIEFYNHALKVHTQRDFPLDWAIIQNNLALAYRDQITGNRAKNIEHAISHCHNVLKIYNLGSMPNDFLRICKLLGNLYLDIGQWEDALESYKDAISAGDFIYHSSLSAESKSYEVAANADIYQNACLAACRMGLTEEALLMLEAGKTRLLSETLRLKMKQPDDVPKNEWIKYEQAAENHHIAMKRSDSEEDYAQRENRVQEACGKLETNINNIRSYKSEFQKELEISDILSIPDQETALLTFCITDKGSIGFVVSGSYGIKSVDIPDFKTEDLNSLLFQLDGHGSIIGGWLNDYFSYVNALRTFYQAYNTQINECKEERISKTGSQLLDDYISFKSAFQKLQNTLDYLLSIIGTTLFYPLLAELPLQTKRLILLPTGGLFLFPLHAIPLYDDQPLCQHYCLSYIPSLQLLIQMKKRVGIVKGKELYAVINPQVDPALVFSEYEGRAISKLFNSSQVSLGEIATKATILSRIPGRAYLHFSCHASYDWNDPPQSGLYLVGGQKLSLADLQTDVVDMSSARLVTLSACETGIIDIVKNSADEFVGLPAGFMHAGAPCVVSSLWSVPDISTAILMERFYSNHIAKGMDIPLALQDAQLWVRGLTSKQVADCVEKCYLSGKWESKSKEFIERDRDRYLKMAEKSPDEKPFIHPYYWAAFTVNGA